MIEDYPDAEQNPALMLQAAELYLEFDNKHSAFNCLNIAIRNFPTDSHCLQLRGDIHFKDGKYNSAISDYTRSLIFCKKKPEITMGKLATAYLRKGDVSSAEIWADKTLLQPGSKLQALAIKSRCRIKSNDPDNAEIWADQKLSIARAENLEKDIIVALSLKTTCRMMKNDFDAAEEFIREQLVLNPDDTHALGQQRRCQELRALSAAKHPTPALML